MLSTSWVAGSRTELAMAGMARPEGLTAAARESRRARVMWWFLRKCKIVMLL